jgi:DNA repair protein RadC
MTEENRLGIKHWAEDDRPREKMLLKGRSALSDAELLAILIATGSKNETAVDLAKKVLNLAQNKLNDLGKLSIADLKKVKGRGEAKAITIAAALELGRRRKHETSEQRKRITNTNDAYEIMQAHFADLDHEQFWMVLLNRANMVIKKQLVSIGGVNATVADIKLMMKSAVENLASSIIVYHNHPSGSLTPSEQDKKLTAKIRQAAELMDMSLIDHIIVGHNTYYSFANEGLL